MFDLIGGAINRAIKKLTDKDSSSSSPSNKYLHQ